MLEIRKDAGCCEMGKGDMGCRMLDVECDLLAEVYQVVEAVFCGG